MELPTSPSLSLTGKKALVTGGSRGIGLGCAVVMAEAGAEVVIAARDPARVAEAETAMRRRGWSVRGRTLDITDIAATRALIAEEGSFDILCNAAGTARHSAADATREADFDAVTALNFKAAYFVAQAVAEHMPAGGSIIQISSQMGHVAGPDRAVYAATKHAVEGMTKGMAIDWGKRGIRVNTICPTFVLTELTKPILSDPDTRQWVEGKLKLPRMATVSDIMGAALFLASDASAMITGTAIMVDGGWTAG